MGRAPSKPARRVAEGDAVAVTEPPPVVATVQPEAICLDVVFENDDLLVVNKPAGMVVHPAPGHDRGTLVNAVLARCPELGGIGGEVRPGIVHRLDKDTSGLIVVAKHDVSHRDLAAQLMQRRFHKRYLALVVGQPLHDSASVDAPIRRHPIQRKRMAVVGGGREAVTRFRVVERLPGFALLEVEPVTGRTHQIRVHLSYIGYPIAGDPIYGGRAASKRVPLLGRQFLHAARLRFALPGGGECREFVAPLPADLEAVLESLRR